MRLIASLLALLSVLPATAANWSLAELLAARRAVVEVRANFVQVRYSLLLEAPLHSRGRLYYRAPDFLSQEIDAPFASRKTLNGDTLSMWRDGRSHSLSLRSYPRAGLYARALRGVLGGQLDDLDEHFEISLSGGEDDWVLRLSPRKDLSQDSRRNGNIDPSPSYIEICGQREQLRRIVLRQSATERTVIQIREDLR